jgi:regulator of replication initiation timing
LEHCISALAEWPGDPPAPGDKDCEAQLLARIAALKDELERSSAAIASVLDRAATAGYADREVMGAVTFLEEAATSRANQDADRRMLDTMSQFRAGAERRVQDMTKQLDQLKKRNATLEEEKAQLQKRVADLRTSHEAVLVDEKKQRQVAEERLQTEVRVRTELLRSVASEPFDEDLLRGHLESADRRLYEKWREREAQRRRSTCADV